MTHIRAVAALTVAAAFAAVTAGGAARDEKLALVTVVADHSKPANTPAPPR